MRRALRELGISNVSIFLTVYPRDFATGNPITVKATSNGDSAYVNRTGGPWLPALTEGTTLKRDFFDGDFSQALSPPAASVRLSVPVLAEVHAQIARARWQGAKVVIEFWDGGSAQTLFTGVVSTFNQQAGILSLSAEIDTEPFEADVLTAAYAGTTGIEGVADLAETPKPFLLGRCYNVEPVLIDVVDNVYQVSAYGPIHAITEVYERGASFGPKVGDYANYAALVAADIKEGEWGSCLAQGLFRLGAPAYGVITADVDGDKPSTWLSLTGAIIKRICANAGISTDLIDAASLDAMDADKPYAIGIYITDQQSVLEVARRLCLPLNYQAGLDATGRLFALKISLSSPVMTLDGQGRALPPVIGDPTEQNTSPPYKRIMMGYRRAWRVHSNDEIATAYQLVERGDWQDGETYREGNLVRMPDGSRWVYVATSAGNDAEPGTDGAVWQGLADADGRVTTFISETEPTAINIGDLWFKESTGELRRWDGAAWGDPLVDLTAAAVPYLEPASRTISVNADYLGVVDTAALPIGLTVARYRGDTNVSATTTWSIADKSPSDGGTVTVSGTGAVSITAVTKSFTFKVRAARDGITLDSLISVTRVDAPPPSTGGGSGSAGTTVFDTSFASFSSSTMTPVSDLMTVKTGASGQIAFSAALNLTTGAGSPDGSWNAALQWRWRPVGGSWTDLTEGAGVVPTTCIFDDDAFAYVVEDGAVVSSPTVTGLSANTNYEVQLLARRSSGTTRTLLLNGNAVATGS